MALKSSLGHSESASGMSSIIHAMSLIAQSNVCPTVHLRILNEHINAHYGTHHLPNRVKTSFGPRIFRVPASLVANIKQDVTNAPRRCSHRKVLSMSGFAFKVQMHTL